MILNLLSVVATDNNVMTKEVVLEKSSIVNKLGEFCVLEKKPFALTIKHSKNNEIQLIGETSVTLEFPCDRCLQPVRKDVAIVIDKDISLNEVSEDFHIIEEKNYIDGYNLDVDEMLLCEIMIGWPMKILCCETCKGVCNVCGQNLNEATCNCEDTGIDPRMSVIRDVFKNFKEV